MMINCLLAGVGGQGTVLASRLIAWTAMNKGMMVRTSETIGMAQRGGCVVSHVRMGEEIHSPLIPLKSADVIIGFEPAEAVRYLSYLKENGAVIVNKNVIKPVTDSLAKTDYSGDEMIAYLRKNVKNLVVVDGDAVTAACGSPRVLNAALLGAAAAAGVLGFSMDDLEKIVREKLPEKHTEMNLYALKVGAGAFLKENKI